MIRGKWLLFVLITWLLPAQPRIVSFTSPSTETVYAVGGGKLLVGVTDVSVFPEQIQAEKVAQRIKVIGHFSDYDPAVLASLKPTLILTGTSFQQKLRDQLVGLGYRVLHCDPKTLEDVFEDMERIGDAIQLGAKARQLVAGMRQELKEIRMATAPLSRPRVYLEMNHMGPWTNGAGSPLEDILIAAGGKNIFADDPRGAFRTTNQEVARRNPEIILSPIWLNAKLGGLDGITPLSEIFSRPELSDTSAIMNSRVHYYDSALLKHTGPRQVLAVRKLAHILHPESMPTPPNTIPWEFGRIRP